MVFGIGEVYILPDDIVYEGAAGELELESLPPPPPPPPPPQDITNTSEISGRAKCRENFIIIKCLF